MKLSMSGLGRDGDRRAPDDMSSEELFEGCEISGLCGVDERVDEPPLLGGAGPPARFAGETEAGTGDELPGFASLSASTSAIRRYG